MVNAFIMRLNMSVAIVAMVEAPEVKNHTHECRAMNNPTNVSIRQNSTVRAFIVEIITKFTMCK